MQVLMDTGATSANYISKTCLDEMRNSLGQGKVKPMKGVVTLGDSQSVASLLIEVYSEYTFTGGAT